MADSNKPMKSSSDRRTFLKIGAGVVAGAAIATVVEVPYYGSVLGGNSSSSSSTVSSLKSQLSSTQEQLSSTAAQLNAAQGQVTSLNNQLSSTAAQLTSANSQLSGVNTQLSSTQQALTSANGQVSSLGGQVTSLGGQVSSLNSAVTSANSQVTSLQGQVQSAQATSTALQTQIATVTGFLTLNTIEQAVVEAMAETIIPTDSNGPGAKEAGVIYFIDRQLASDYGKNGNMYNRGPFVMAGMNGPITVNNLAGQPITYSGGSMITAPTAGTKYQYGVLFRDFWRYGVQALETYSNSAYGGNFETLSAANQVKALTDLTKNTPTSFNGIVPSDFFNEVFFMTWCGFLMDPLWGGNQGMVGWELTGFNGTNMGNFYGEGMTTKQLMVSTTPTRLKPASLAQFQQAAGAGT
jgi:gluconate 2-dehydrogenase gamma chain